MPTKLKKHSIKKKKVKCSQCHKESKIYDLMLAKPLLRYYHQGLYQKAINDLKKRAKS